jgi:hypothetical protein
MKRSRFFKSTTNQFVSSRRRLMKKRQHQKSMYRRKQFILMNVMLEPLDATLV